MSQTMMFGPASQQAVDECGALALKKQFHAELDDGVVCPTCHRFAKRYKRKLGGQQVVWLMWLVREFGRTGEWVCIQDTASWARYRGDIVGGDYGKLVHWGLVMRMGNDDPTKKSSGYWKPTQLGIDFVMQRVKVPSHVYLYNNTVDGWSETSVAIRECLGVKFDYSELMGHKIFVKG